MIYASTLDWDRTHLDGTCKSTRTFDSARRAPFACADPSKSARKRERERERVRQVLIMLTLFHHAKVHLLRYRGERRGRRKEIKREKKKRRRGRGRLHASMINREMRRKFAHVLTFSTFPLLQVDWNGAPEIRRETLDTWPFPLQDSNDWLVRSLLFLVRLCHLQLWNPL